MNPDNMRYEGAMKDFLRTYRLIAQLPDEVLNNACDLERDTLVVRPSKLDRACTISPSGENRISLVEIRQPADAELHSFRKGERKSMILQFKDRRYTIFETKFDKDIYA